MQIFTQLINAIAHRKVLSRQFHGKTPNLSYNGLDAKEQTALIMALVNEDEEVRDFIANRITYAIEDAYCDEMRISEAEEDKIDLANLALDDAAQRARDINIAIRGC